MFRDVIWLCILIIMIIKWLFSGILFICSLVVSFAALALRARAANDTTRAQINNIPSKSHFIVLLVGNSQTQINAHASTYYNYVILNLGGKSWEICGRSCYYLAKAPTNRKTTNAILLTERKQFKHPYKQPTVHQFVPFGDQNNKTLRKPATLTLKMEVTTFILNTHIYSTQKHHKI